MLKFRNLEYDVDEQENSIFNHPNVVRTMNSRKSDHNMDNDVSKCQSKNRSGDMQISQFLGSMSKMDDNFAEKINQYMQSNIHGSIISSFNDSSTNNKDIEALMKNNSQSSKNKQSNNKTDIDESFHELLDGDESLFKSKFQSSSRKEKRRMIRELLKHKENPALRAKTRLLMSSYLLDEDSPSHGRSKITKEEDDLKLSQTKMDEIAEVENEEQDNEAFNDFINNVNHNQSSVHNQKQSNTSSNNNEGRSGTERYTTDDNTQTRRSPNHESLGKQSNYRGNDSVIDASK